MNCVPIIKQKSDGSYAATCVNCKRSFPPLAEYPENGNLVRTCKNPNKRDVMGCALRGEQARVQICPSCCGGVGTKIKVFACETHGECVIDKQGLGLPTCARCPDFTASVSTAPRRLPETAPTSQGREN